LLLTFALFTSLWQIYRSGHLLLVFIFTPLVMAVLYGTWCDRDAVDGLNIQGEVWQLCLKDQWIDIELSHAAVILPLFVYLAWRETGSRNRGALCLFSDSVTPRQWRRLRVRLNLARHSGE
jgi:hypothetical protein